MLWMMFLMVCSFVLALPAQTKSILVITEQVVDLDGDPFVPNGWVVEEHRKGGQFKWNASKVKLYLSTGQQDGKWIEGNKLREELKERPVYNANLLDYLLEHSHLIPTEWKGKAVFFWGTIYRDSNGLRSVRHLYWDGYGGGWSHGLLDAGWDDDGPAAVPAS